MVPAGLATSLSRSRSLTARSRAGPGTRSTPESRPPAAPEDKHGVDKRWLRSGCRLQSRALSAPRARPAPSAVRQQPRG